MIPETNGATPSPYVTLLPQSNYLLSLMTTIRSTQTEGEPFVSAVSKVARLLLQEALNRVPVQPHNVQTPTGSTYSGLQHTGGVCGVSVLRAGSSMEQALRETWSGRLSFGQILIQRDEATSLPTYYYSKLPEDIHQQTVLLLEPMLATGGSSAKAIEVLLAKGVPEENIVFVNVIASELGIARVSKRFPGLRVVTAAIDEKMTASK
ncbi:hypothetical protein MBLNU459_g0627t1 [Dothideomycetes sp. NU459]